ncbi:aminotransferase class IV family protein [Gaoshiqia sp. Z1-71]|uniref:aminotransferase class IV family protein n=1 Tax=Gaoshiqia hydrogeniformans TaxID=3290090 RepID=UPI003BF7DB5F
MCPLLETIKLEDGCLCNIAGHNRRMNAARTELFQRVKPIDLAEIIRIPENCRSGLYRCRILYGRDIEKIEFIKKAPRKFNKLKVVRHDEIDYHLKYADRTILNDLYARRGDADEIIIIKQGLVTDCTIGNLVFWDKNRWITPDSPLLNGTQRQSLLEQNLIVEKRISGADLAAFSQAGIINVFHTLENMPVISGKNIITG